GRVIQDRRNMLCQQIGQPSPAVMEPQNLSPEVLGPTEQVGAEAEDVGQDEILCRAFSEMLSGVPVVRQKQGIMVLGVDLPYDAVAQPGKQVGQAQADFASHADVIPWQRVKIGSAQL